MSSAQMIKQDMLQQETSSHQIQELFQYVTSVTEKNMLLKITLLIIKFASVVEYCWTGHHSLVGHPTEGLQGFLGSINIQFLEKCHGKN